MSLGKTLTFCIIQQGKIKTHKNFFKFERKEKRTERKKRKEIDVDYIYIYIGINFRE